jgi:hypothetical protein
MRHALGLAPTPPLARYTLQPKGRVKDRSHRSDAANLQGCANTEEVRPLVELLFCYLHLRQGFMGVTLQPKESNSSDEAKLQGCTNAEEVRRVCFLFIL